MLKCHFDKPGRHSNSQTPEYEKQPESFTEEVSEKIPDLSPKNMTELTAKPIGDEKTWLLVGDDDLSKILDTINSQPLPDWTHDCLDTDITEKNAYKKRALFI